MGKTAVQIVLMMILVALTAILVPSLTPLPDPEYLTPVNWADITLHNHLVIAQWGPLTLTGWGVSVALGLGAAALLTMFLGRKHLSSTLSLILSASVGGILGGRILYCLAAMDLVQVYYGGIAFLPQMWLGGFTLYGAVLGAIAATALYAAAKKKPLAPLMSLLAPGGALVLMVERFAEALTDQGLGDYIFDESLAFFPVTVTSSWGDLQVPVFFYEGVMAAVLLAVSLIHCRKQSGWEIFTVLLALSQIFLESLREDEFICYGFVRFNQLASAAVLAVLLFIRIRRQVKTNGRWTLWAALRILLSLMGAGMVILLEFALDKSEINNLILYGVMAVTLVVMGIAALKQGTLTARHRKGESA